MKDKYEPMMRLYELLQKQHRDYMRRMDYIRKILKWR